MRAGLAPQLAVTVFSLDTGTTALAGGLDANVGTFE
jgi:hypothetical protein